MKEDNPVRETGGCALTARQILIGIVIIAIITTVFEVLF